MSHKFMWLRFLNFFFFHVKQSPHSYLWFVTKQILNLRVQKYNLIKFLIVEMFCALHYTYKQLHIFESKP
jgi:hypothetical protein